MRRRKSEQAGSCEAQLSTRTDLQVITQRLHMTLEFKCFATFLKCGIDVFGFQAGRSDQLDWAVEPRAISPCISKSFCGRAQTEWALFRRSIVRKAGRGAADLRGHRGALRARQQSSFGSARSATGFAQRPASGSSEQCWATQTRNLLQAQSDQKCVSASPLLPSPPPSNLLRVTLPIHHLKNVPGQHRYQRVSIFLAPSSSSFDSGAGCDRRRATLSGRLAPCFR